MSELIRCADCHKIIGEKHACSCDACSNKICSDCAYCLTSPDENDYDWLCKQCANAPWGLRDKYAELLKKVHNAIGMLTEDTKEQNNDGETR